MYVIVKIVWVGVLSALVGGTLVNGGIAWAQPAQPTEKPAAKAEGAKAEKPLGVDEVVKDPAKHQGRIVVEGVVAKVMGARRTFTLIDAKEFAACGVTTCAEYSLPVIVPESDYRGALPKEKETLVLTGELTTLDKGFRFDVSEVKKAEKVVISRIDFSPAALLARRVELKLTDEQAKRLEALKSDLEAERERLQSGIAHCEEEMKEAWAKEPPDAAKATHEQQEIAELGKQLAEASRKAAEEAKTVLTDSQRKGARG